VKHVGKSPNQDKKNEVSMSNAFFSPVEISSRFVKLFFKPNRALSHFETVFVLSCDFIYFIYVICLGKLYIREGDMYWKLQGGMLQREGKRMTDLVIKSGDLIRDRHHPREPKHW